MEEELKNNGNQTKKPRKRPVRSPYLFPSYDYGVARKIVETVERDGAGTLTEETLAIALDSSVKSSGFRLRALAARQFGLLVKQGDVLKTTPLAKAIIKPTDDEERGRAVIESFLNIPLFKVIAARFQGQPLPQGTTFRNILEREFKIESNRVNEAERIFMDSAREAGLLQTSGTNTYLVTQITPGQSKPTGYITNGQPEIPPPSQPPKDSHDRYDYYTPPPPVSGGILDITQEDLDYVNDDEFPVVWETLGKIIRARRRRRIEEGESDQNE